MSNHPKAVGLVIAKKFPLYTEAVEAAFLQRSQAARTVSDKHEIARALIDQFSYEALIDEDDYDDPAAGELQRIERVSIFLEEASDYGETLEDMPERAFLALYDVARRAQTSSAVRRAKFRDSKMFVNLPDARADLVRWRGLAYWTVDETTAICLGKDPRVVNEATMVPGSVGPLPVKCPPLHEDSPFLESYRDWKMHVLRAFEVGELGSFITPEGVIRWIQDRVNKQLALPAAVRRRLVENSDSDDIERELDKMTADLDSAERRIRDLENRLEQLTGGGGRVLPHQPKKLYSIILGMAHDKYSFGRKNEKSTVQNIDDALARAGVPVDNDTIRTILASAKAALDWVPRQPS